MAKILDFLSRLYSRRAKSDDPAYNLGWSAALAFRNDKNLSSYRNFVLAEFGLSEEELDGRYAAETLRSEINPNWNTTLELIIVAAERVGIEEEFISLAKENSSAAKLLWVHFKLLGEIEKYGKVVPVQEVIRSQIEKYGKVVSVASIIPVQSDNADDSDDASEVLSKDQIKDIIQLGKTARYQFYVEHSVPRHLRFLIDFSCICVTGDGEFLESAVEEYISLWAVDENEMPQSERLGKIELLQRLLNLLDAAQSDAARSSGQDVNIMAFSILLFAENEPDAVDFIITNILRRSRNTAVKNNDEFFAEKFFLENLFSGRFQNDGAVFGSILKHADRRLITQVYKHFENLDHDEVHNAVFCCESTTSAPAIDFLVDWAMHLKNVGQEQTANLVAASLSRISKKLKGHNLTDGSFKEADLWSEGAEQRDPGFSVPFVEYMKKHAGKIDSLLELKFANSNYQIEVCVSDPDDTLEAYRDDELAQVWRLFAEGYWGQDKYHMGYIEYSVARSVGGMWLMNACSRYECLDNVTQTDLDKNQLTDDQSQAIFDHGSLEVAQQFRYNRIVAVSSAFEGHMNWRLVGEKLYQAVIAAGGKKIRAN